MIDLRMPTIPLDDAHDRSESRVGYDRSHLRENPVCQERKDLITVRISGAGFPTTSRSPEPMNVTGNRQPVAAAAGVLIARYTRRLTRPGDVERLRRPVLDDEMQADRTGRIRDWTSESLPLHLSVA